MVEIDYFLTVTNDINCSIWFRKQFDNFTGPTHWLSSTSPALERPRHVLSLIETSSYSLRNLFNEKLYCSLQVRFFLAFSLYCFKISWSWLLWTRRLMGVTVSSSCGCDGQPLALSAIISSKLTSLPNEPPSPLRRIWLVDVMHDGHVDLTIPPFNVHSHAKFQGIHDAWCFRDNCWCATETKSSVNPRL